MIVWGGVFATPINNGGLYNPSFDSWRPTSTGSSVPTERLFHSAVWTGSEMIVWGGKDGTTPYATGGHYHPDSDTWNATTTVDAPAPRYQHTAVWTGSEMIVWGGANDTDYFDTGASYRCIPD